MPPGTCHSVCMRSVTIGILHAEPRSYLMARTTSDNTRHSVTMSLGTGTHKIGAPGRPYVLGKSIPPSPRGTRPFDQEPLLHVFTALRFHVFHVSAAKSYRGADTRITKLIRAFSFFLQAQHPYAKPLLCNLRGHIPGLDPGAHARRLACWRQRRSSQVSYAPPLHASFQRRVQNVLCSHWFARSAKHWPMRLQVQQCHSPRCRSRAKVQGPERPIPMCFAVDCCCLPLMRTWLFAG